MDMNLRYCMILLQQTMLDLTARELRHFRANVGIVRQNSFGGTYHVVEWPKMDKDGGTYMWEGQSDNRYHAKAEAIGDWLKVHAPSVRARHLEKGFPEEVPAPVEPTRRRAPPAKVFVDADNNGRDARVLITPRPRSKRRG
jgi:hypothetical protein